MRTTEDFLVPNNANFIRLRVNVWRPETVVASLICLHDYLGDGGDFFPLCEALAEKGVKVISADFPGRGQSAALETGSYGLEAYFACVGHLYSLCERNCVLLGSGWGGAIALSFLAARRLRFHGLILHNPLLWSGPFYRRGVSFAELEASQVFRSFEEGAAYLLGTRPALKEAGEPLLSEILARKLRAGSNGFSVSWDRSLKEEYTQLVQFDLRPLLIGAPSPTLLMTSDEYLDLEGAQWIPPKAASRLLTVTQNELDLGSCAFLSSGLHQQIWSFLDEKVLKSSPALSSPTSL